MLRCEWECVVEEENEAQRWRVVVEVGGVEATVELYVTPRWERVGEVEQDAAKFTVESLDKNGIILKINALANPMPQCVVYILQTP